MILTAALSLAAPVSPAGIEVTTRDGHTQIVVLTDADAVATEVCATVGAGDAVCGPVVVDRRGIATAAVAVDDSEDVRFTIRQTRFDARTNAPAALAIGLGVASVGCAASAIALSSMAASMAVPDPISGVVSGQGSAADAASPWVAGLWLGAGSFAVGATVVGLIAATNAGIVD